ncbi:MAG: GNAT family N-acetyltransferase [Nanoarchaeota archaeon]|nr:GNAT family N-acetyltransferase [Nanoarchaeota archaeon]
MKIRKAKKEDIKKINEIYEQGLFQEYSFQYPKNKTKIQMDVEYDSKFHKRMIKKNLKDKKQYWIVIEIDEKIMGVGSAYIKRDKGIIESVYISKSFQRKGYGQKIIKELIRWVRLKKAKRIESNFLVKNNSSIKLHEKLGFKPYVLKVRLK